ncbi:BTB/POZ domain-containing protein 1 [Trametes pubescens]|uniref:BTB/POZ domain-containing protein 1 n=1 Tax=Trametes pubescens TaxID=154538 RepID=A0A1M2W686_TRAPU|nr:BTB/POZ domain-containing protein 1 [Trametes pubescens]
MTALHAHFHQRNQQAFQRLLDSGRSPHSGPSTSGGKSWSRPSPLSAASSVDVNARDHLGRTVLHLAASAQDAAATEYVRMLLAHPTVSVNIADAESHWTPLHRALYHGNLATALLLLQRQDVDTSVRDTEGYTPFDLYNSTIEGTLPEKDANERGDELYTWGSNRNAALGVGDGDDRTYPELLSLRISPVPETEPIDSRLGPGQHTQYAPIPLPGFNQTVKSVAPGQDHTLILTKTGEVYSWGLNRFSQLGYVVETATGARSEEPIQATPRKISGAIRNRTVLGVAACKTASVCWTADEVFTWGTNNGQLGYDRAAHPVQLQPRVVTKITKPVTSVSITDSALACLVDTQEVICLWNDGHFKVNFPAYSFPSEFVAYRPPQAATRNSASIDKITSCEDTFAALSSSGEVFTFSLPPPPDVSASATKSRFVVQPQRVWALRKQFSAVRDVALGVDGSIIICTESGHVFVRSRNLKAGQSSSAKTFRFQRIPYIQRVTQVCANATGAFAALRSDWVPEEVKVVGHRIPQDLATIQPYFHLLSRTAKEDAAPMPSVIPVDASPATVPPLDAESDGEEEDAAVQHDIRQLKSLCEVILRLKEARKGTEATPVFDPEDMPFGADLLVHIQSSGIELPAHCAILAARSTVLCQVLADGKTARDPRSSFSVQGHANKATSRRSRITFTGCHPLSVLILFVYLYADEPLALWDHRIGHAVLHQLELVKAKSVQIKTELQSLASVLDLPALLDVLEAPVKRTPKATLSRDLQQLFAVNQAEGVRSPRPLSGDLVLQLAEREVYCHSAILRARSPFFAALFDDKDWTSKRWTSEGTVIVNLKHLKWRAMESVLKYLCCGGDKEIFDVIADVRSVDELLDFMFEVMAVANELHIDRLMLICSWVIMRRVWINNVCSILTDATHYHARPLVRLLQEYLAINMEVFLESRMLEDLAAEHIKQLSAYVRAEQARKYPVSRSTRIVDKAMEKWGTWLALQDFPQPIVPTARSGAFKDSPKLSPPGPSKRGNRQSSVPSSPMLRPTFSTRPVATGIPDDEMFLMDEPESAPQVPPTPPRATGGESSPAKPAGGWKSITSAPKVDMKAIMAEASTKGGVTRLPAARGPASSLEAISRGPPPARPPAEGVSKAASLPRAPSGGHSWRTPPQGATPSATPATASIPLPAAKEVRPPPSGPAPTPTAGTAAGPSTPRSQPGTPRKPVAPGLGPVFTPTKQASTSTGASSIRRVSSGSVWTPPPVQPVQPVVRASSSSSAVSFAAIQLSQLEQDVAPAKDRRTLVEIQEEERARQVEDDFLRWWTAEEERLKEEQAAVAALVSGRPQKTKKARAPKGKPPAPVREEVQKGGGKTKNVDGPKPQRAKPVERHRGQDGEAQIQVQEQGQSGKPRRRRPAPGAGREDTRKSEAQS